MTDSHPGTLVDAIKAGSYLAGGLGLVSVLVAGGWWAYDTVQSGVTYQELGEFGAGLLFVAFFAYMCAKIIESDPDDDTSLLFGGDEHER